MTAELITVDGEVVEEHRAPMTLFGTDEPQAVVERASTVATALAGVINERKLFSSISGKKHVQVEGWTLLGSMLGVFAEVEWSRPLDNGWEARAVARTLAGQVVGAAEAMCTTNEGRWGKADAYAVRSMAQTRAVSKALRLPLGFIMQLAGYSATPAEELNDEPRQGVKTEPDRARQASREASSPVPASATQAGVLSDATIRIRYNWAERHGWSGEALDDVAIAASGKTPMEMDSLDWQLFAATIKDGPNATPAVAGEQAEPEADQAVLSAPAEPPRSGTDEYKALDVRGKAQARSYWATKDLEGRQKAPLNPEQTILPVEA
jgi:hypothetical protein